MDTTLLLFGGAVVSVLMEIIKKFFGMDRVKTLSMVLILSLVCSIGYWYLQYAGLFESFIQIVSGAALIYAFIIKNIEVAVAKK